MVMGEVVWAGNTEVKRLFAATLTFLVLTVSPSADLDETDSALPTFRARDSAGEFVLRIRDRVAQIHQLPRCLIGHS
jgi:hypothetical protein